LPLDQRREVVGGVALATRKHVSVHRHRHDRAGMAEAGGDDVHRLAGGQHDRGVRVPKVVKPDHRQGLLAELGAAAGDVPAELELGYGL
jgi:hypothetical protein